MVPWGFYTMFTSKKPSFLASSVSKVEAAMVIGVAAKGLLGYRYARTSRANHIRSGVSARCKDNWANGSRAGPLIVFPVV